MGLLSFLSRKPTSENLRRDELKAQAYDTTVASLPPILGTTPVTGNGQNILEQFQKSHPDLRDVHRSGDNSAPTPLVPRIRHDGIVRPGTSVSTKAAETIIRPRSESGAGEKRRPQLREPPKKRHGPYKLPSKISVDPSETTKPVYSAPSPAFVRHRSSSVQSSYSASAGGFVDLLEAQSHIKPLDFYGRVKATGVKDYGEDVADRNLREDELNSDSYSAQELGMISHDMGTGHMASEADPDETEDAAARRLQKRHSLGSSLRTKSQALTKNTPFPKRTSSRLPYVYKPSEQQPMSREDDKTIREKSELKKRRRSLPSFVPHVSSTDRPRSSSRGTPSKQTDPNYFPDSLRDRALAAAHLERPNALPAKQSSSIQETPLSRKARDSLYVKGKTSQYQPVHAREASEHSLPDYDDVCPRSAKQSSRRRTFAAYTRPSSSNSKAPSKRRSFQGAQSLARSDSRMKTDTPDSDTPSLPKERDYRPDALQSTHLNDVHDGAVNALPPLRPSHRDTSFPRGWPESSREQSSYHGRNRSIASISSRSIKQFGIEESIPERTSSLRNWSLTSETAVSTQSSNPFRPQSGHTTTTSVDIASFLPSSRSVKSSRHQPTLHSPTSKTHIPTTRSTTLSRYHQHPNEFNMDDYISSDESNEVSARPRGEYEEDLLFAPQGYGFDGSQLPGLPGLFDAAVVPPRRSPPRRSSPPPPRARIPHDHQRSYHFRAFSSSPGDAILSACAPSPQKDRTRAYEPQRRDSQFQMPSFGYSDAEDDDTSEGVQSDSDDELNFDIPMMRAGAAHHGISQGGKWRHYEEDLIEEEEEDQGRDMFDISAAIRLRREAKSRNWANGQSLRRNTDRARFSAVHSPIISLDDHSGDADAES
ncbi:hypothetical protein F4778DRAFT_335967 [Xylariomycetidae sp. FL2044]|nr:hypothetical protein F4778DRAFT_335967 [Xylariomycetidae sp. FL2044]